MQIKKILQSILEFFTLRSVPLIFPATCDNHCGECPVCISCKESVLMDFGIPLPRHYNNCDFVYSLHLDKLLASPFATEYQGEEF